MQLLHLFSGKYIAINPVETSKTEPDINVQGIYMHSYNFHMHDCYIMSEAKFMDMLHNRLD